MAHTATLEQELSELSDAEVGQEVSFYYRGEGSHANAQRHATVLEQRSDGILGQDTDHDGPRYFKDAEAYDVSIVSKIEGERISFPAAQSKLVDEYSQHEIIINTLTGEQLATVYANICGDNQTGEFVDGYIVLSDKYNGPTVTLENTANGGKIHIKGRDSLLSVCLDDTFETLLVSTTSKSGEIRAEYHCVREMCNTVLAFLDSEE